MRGLAVELRDEMLHATIDAAMVCRCCRAFLRNSVLPIFTTNERLHPLRRKYFVAR